MMDVPQQRQVRRRDQYVAVQAVQWDNGTAMQLEGTGPQQAQLYASDCSAVKDVDVNEVPEMCRHVRAIFDGAEDAGDMFFTELTLQNVDGATQKWCDTDCDEGEFAAAATRVDYVILIRSHLVETATTLACIQCMKDVLTQLPGRRVFLLPHAVYSRSLRRWALMLLAVTRRARFVNHGKALQHLQLT
jgi:hypothetical protein